MSYRSASASSVRSMVSGIGACANTFSGWCGNGQRLAVVPGLEAAAAGHLRVETIGTPHGVDGGQGDGVLLAAGAHPVTRFRGGRRQRRSPPASRALICCTSSRPRASRSASDVGSRAAARHQGDAGQQPQAGSRQHSASNSSCHGWSPAETARSCKSRAARRWREKGVNRRRIERGEACGRRNPEPATALRGRTTGRLPDED